jgi:hypothetical protein
MIARIGVGQLHRKLVLLFLRPSVADVAGDDRHFGFPLCSR